MKGNIRKDTIAHYDRIITWIGNQDPEGRNHIGVMRWDLEETYMGEFCPVCLAYRESGHCKKCPIYRYQCINPETVNDFFQGCLGTPWEDLFDAHTWGEALVAAKAEREFLIKVFDWMEAEGV